VLPDSLFRDSVIDINILVVEAIFYAAKAYDMIDDDGIKSQYIYFILMKKRQ